jgi:hypothetical protein
VSKPIEVTCSQCLGTSRVPHSQLEELIAKAIAWGVHCKAADEPGLSPAGAWEQSAAEGTRSLYREDALEFLRAVTE